MNEAIYSYLEKFEEQTKQRFCMLYGLIYESTSRNIDEKLWAKLPSFYVDDNVIRLIPFKDHINVEAKAVIFHKDELSDYKITPKGMLQIYHNQQVPCELLKVIFEESFEQNKKVLIDELETSDYDIFHEVTYKGKSFTGIGFDDTPSFYSEYCYIDGKGHGKCFTVSKTGQKLEEFELNEGEHIGEGYRWYPSGQLKEYTRYTPTRFTRKWSESGVLLLEDDEELKVRREYYSTGELKLEYRKPIECICYSKKGVWIFKHKYENGKEWLIFDIAYFIFNELYIEENYNEILYEDSLQNYIFLWLMNLLIIDNKKAIKIICNLINHENLHAKDRAIFIACENQIIEAKPFLIKALKDKRIPPTENDFINGGSIGYTRTISQQARIALDKLK